MPKRRKTDQPVIPSAPEPKEKSAQEQYKSVSEAVTEEVNKRGYESKFSLLNKGQDVLMLVMAGFIVVLFVGFITLLLAVLSILIQWWGFNSNIQSDLVKSINQETEAVTKITKQVNILNSRIEVNASPTP